MGIYVKMVLQKLLQLLMSHPQYGPRLIQKLADSWPIRKAARFTAYLYLRGKHAIEESAKNVTKTEHHKMDQIDTSKFDANRFKETFKNELKKEWEKKTKS